MGLRGAWLNQKFKSSLTQPIFVPSVTEYDFHGKNNYWGIGPRLGIHSQWHIANSEWSILCKASSALLVGKTQAKMSNTYVSGGVTTTERETKDNFTQLVLNLQLFLGVDWGTCFDCDQYYLGINAGWETDIYWNQYNVPSTLRTYPASLPGSNQAVTMEGLTVNVHFDF